MLGGKDYITEEIASILASMISKPDDHTLLGLTASPFYHASEDGDAAYDDGTVLVESTYEVTKKCSTVDCDGYGTTWCVQCCFKNPLSPCFLCNDRWC
jgi:hypothetical protein